MSEVSEKIDFPSLGRLEGVTVSPKNRPVVCIQGLGFVGSVMAVAVAMAKHKDEEPFFNVVGIDLPNRQGNSRVNSLNSGKFPIKNKDKSLSDCFEKVHAQGNLLATTDKKCFSLADIVLVDINLDLEVPSQGDHTVSWINFRNAIADLGKFLKPGALVIIETTVPPGTTQKIVVPTIASELSNRNLSPDSIQIAHSYERVMPGNKYLSSITDYWRVYAGYTEEAADLCERFLSKVINVQDYPLYRLKSTLDSETAKILENTYRAINIAFMAEWGRFAEKRGVDLFEVIKAIRLRPTHSNIMQPGFGVGGYCLPKDPGFMSVSSRELYKDNSLHLPVTEMAFQINLEMPNNSIIRAKDMLGGSLKGKNILLLGISYRSDVSDTRNSPSQYFFEKVIDQGAEVVCYDPIVEYWDEIGIKIPNQIPDSRGFDLVVFAVQHEEFKNLNIGSWIGETTLFVLDANNVLSKKQREEFESSGCPTVKIGAGRQNE